MKSRSMQHQTASACSSARSQAHPKRSILHGMRRLISAAAIMAAAAACLPAGLRAQDTGAAGGTIDSIEVTGHRRVSRETIVNTLGIIVPSSITFRDVQRGVRALFSLQQFDDVQVT